jgi:hypothetical protein
MEKTKRIAAYLSLPLLIFAGSCPAAPEPVCHYDISGIRLGMPLAEVEQVVSESELVEIMRDGEASGRQVMKLFLELDDRHIVVTFKARDKVPMVRTVEVEFLDAIFVADGRAVPNGQILEEITRRLGAPMKKDVTKGGELSHGLWFASSYGTDMKYFSAGLASCHVSLYFGRFPKGNARVNMEDLSTL